MQIDVDGETIAKVNSLKYLGAIKTSTGSCSEDIKERLGRKGQTRAYWMTIKLDSNSLPRLSKEKWLSLDMHAETTSAI